MQEIYSNGPVACGIASTNELKNYTSGIFADKSGVYTYNHYVSLFGWGETATGAKYWLIQNSYGPTWGDEGNLKLLRG
jgi:C1A family cysteine protease